MRSFNRSLIAVAAAGLLVFEAGAIWAHGNERAEAKATVSDAHVVIEYGRPMLKHRDISKLIQPGQMWRIGADNPTTFQCDRDLDFARTRLPKGKYVMLARLIEPGKWALVFSKKSVSQYEPSAKVAEAPLEFRREADAVEELTIHLSSQGDRGVIEIAWGAARLSASFTPSM